jgi:uncharacterized protein YaaN involved in tellurite resistance
MTTKTQNGTETGNATLKAYEDKIKAQVQEAKAKLEQFEAKAKEKKAQADIAAVSNLKAAKQHIDQKVHDLKTIHDAHGARQGRHRRGRCTLQGVGR